MSLAAGREIWVIGSGKMALDIGLFLWSRGYEVTWRSNRPEALAAIEDRVARKTRRLIAMSGSDETPRPCRFAPLDRAAARPPDIVLETGRELREVKQQTIDLVLPHCRRDTLLLTNSSSILPGDISPRLVGLHFFYPVALTEIVEVIGSPDNPGRERAAALAAEWGFHAVLQRPSNAFVANRLLLPVQVETARRILGGTAPGILEEATASDLLPRGQVTLWDDIGMDIVRHAVGNYISRMPSDRSDYAPLIALLEGLVRSGVLGKKNRRSLINLSPSEIEAIRWGTDVPPATDPPDISEMFRDLFLNTCLRFMDAGESDAATLDTILKGALGAERSLEEVITATGPSAIRDRLESLYRDTGISYFRPCALL